MKNLAEKTSAKLLWLPAAALAATAALGALRPSHDNHEERATSDTSVCIDDECDVAPAPTCGAEGHRCMVAPA